MVDIAIRALSPAVNDPTTAVQVLDDLEETLRVVGAARPGGDAATPDVLRTGVIMPIRTWPDFLALGITEIREYGATSIQVTRRLRALLEELGELVLPENRAAVDEEVRRLEATVQASYANSVDLDRAGSPDHQGIGGPAGAREAPRTMRCDDGRVGIVAGRTRDTPPARIVNRVVEKGSCDGRT